MTTSLCDGRWNGQPYHHCSQSEGTESFDKNDKFRLYRSIPTFREYILVHSSQAAADAFFKAENNLWYIQSSVGLHESLPLQSLGLQLPLSQIYAKDDELKTNE
jgi:Uma2 family endonuclease